MAPVAIRNHGFLWVTEGTTHYDQNHLQTTNSIYKIKTLSSTLTRSLDVGRHAFKRSPIVAAAIDLPSRLIIPGFAARREGLQLRHAGSTRDGLPKHRYKWQAEITYMSTYTTIRNLSSVDIDRSNGDK